MKNSEKYKAEDGLKVLEYLGIRNVTDKEKDVFREKWDKFYTANNQDFVGTVWELYAEALPFICGDGDKGSFMTAQIRDSDFGKRLDVTKLDEELKQGKSLTEILKKGNHKFIKTVPIEKVLRGDPDIFTAD